MTNLQDYHAELQTLFLAMSGHVDEVVARLDRDAFGDWRHKEIFAAIAEIRKKGQDPDFLTVGNWLNAHGRINDTLTRLYVVDIGMQSGGYRNPVGDHYAVERVASLWRARQVISECRRTIEAVEADPETTDETAQAAASKIGSINSGIKERPADIGGLGDTFIEELERRQKEGVPPGLTTGFRNIDNFVCFQPGEMITLAARPSMGKSALAAQMAYRIACTGKRVLFFSLEMSKQSLVGRLFAVQAGVPSAHMRVADIDKDEWGRLVNALGKFHTVPLVFDDQWALGVPALASRARMSKEPYDLLVIDYLQLIIPRTNRKGDNRVAEVSEISRDLKLLAKRLNVPVLALSQLSRAVETRQNKRPMLSDLRDSGAIEQDSDIVLGLYRDEYYNPDTTDRGIAEVIVLKNRNGATGTAPLLYNSVTGAFMDKVVA